MEDILKDYMTEHSYEIQTNQEIANSLVQKALSVFKEGEEFKDPLFNNFNEMFEKFKTVYEFFGHNDELMSTSQARNENEEAAIADLRNTLEELFYEAKTRTETYPMKPWFVRRSTALAIYFMMCIIINMPKLVEDWRKQEILEFVCNRDIVF